MVKRSEERAELGHGEMRNADHGLAALGMTTGPGRHYLCTNHKPETVEGMEPEAVGGVEPETVGGVLPGQVAVQLKFTQTQTRV